MTSRTRRNRRQNRNRTRRSKPRSGTSASRGIRTVINKPRPPVSIPSARSILNRIARMARERATRALVSLSKQKKPSRDPSRPTLRSAAGSSRRSRPVHGKYRGRAVLVSSSGTKSKISLNQKKSPVSRPKRSLKKARNWDISEFDVIDDRPQPKICKIRPDSRLAAKGTGGSKPFVPWCDRRR